MSKEVYDALFDKILTLANMRTLYQLGQMELVGSLKRIDNETTALYQEIAYKEELTEEQRFYLLEMLYHETSKY